MKGRKHFLAWLLIASAVLTLLAALRSKQTLETSTIRRAPSESHEEESSAPKTEPRNHATRLISVRVTDGFHNPIDGATVLRQHRILGRTDSIGCLLVESSAKSILIACTPDGLFWSRPVICDPSEGPGELGLEIPITVLNGLVLGPESTPVAGAAIFLSPSSGAGSDPNFRNDELRRWPAQATTDSQGKFRFSSLPYRAIDDTNSLHPILYTVDLSANGFLPKSCVIQLHPGENNEQVLYLARASRLKVSGKVTDIRAVPLPDSSVRFILASQDGDSKRRTMLCPVTSDGLGRFDVDIELPADWNDFRYSVLVEVKHASFAPQLLSLAPSGLTTPLEIRLENGQSVSGRVQDQDGNGLAAVKIQFVSEEPDGTQTIVEVQSSQDGVFACDSLAVKTYDILASLPENQQSRWKSLKEWKLDITPPATGITLTFTKTK